MEDDLIKRSDVISFCCQYYSICEKDCEHCNFNSKVNAIPTAYDVDNVVEQLKKSSCIVTESDECGLHSDYTDYTGIKTSLAIEIVKKGGNNGKV